VRITERPADPDRTGAAFSPVRCGPRMLPLQQFSVCEPAHKKRPNRKYKEATEASFLFQSDLACLTSNTSSWLLFMCPYFNTFFRIVQYFLWL